MYFSKLHSFPNGAFLFFHYWFCYLISPSKKFSLLSELLAPEEFSAGAIVNNGRGQFPFPKPQPHNPRISGRSKARTAGLITPHAPHWSLRPFVIFVQDSEDTCSDPKGEINRTRFVRFLDHQPAQGRSDLSPDGLELCINRGAHSQLGFSAAALRVHRYCPLDGELS